MRHALPRLPSRRMTGRSLPGFALLILSAGAALLPLGRQDAAWSAEKREAPNVVIIIADDLGYGDLGCYGHPTIRTPHLDRMAAEGMRFTEFYVGGSICTPSRAALLTGRLPIRTGMGGGVLRVNSAGGIPDKELLISEALKSQGYATAAVGKWHLGQLPQYLPTNNGFDTYFGLPYSNDMGGGRWPPVPLIHNGEIIEQPAKQETLTRRYTEHAIEFIRDHQKEPFFLYLAHTFPHTPLHASDKFRGTSARGLYGDVVEELDWSVGQVLDTLRELDLAENTFVFFTSDNGPWLIRGLHGGSAGLLRGGKASTWEGGFRVPGIAWWPGTIEAGQVERDPATTMDLYCAALEIAGASPPEDRILDGTSLMPVLLGEKDRVRDVVFYYRRNLKLYAVRKGPWKAHFVTDEGYGREKPVHHDPPLLFHLGRDPSEVHNLAKKHPEVLAEIQKIVKKHKAQLDPAPSQLKPKLKERPYFPYD